MNDNVAVPGPLPPPLTTRQRVRRWLRRIGLGAGLVLLLGVVVSLISVWRVRDATVAVRADSSVLVTEITQLYPVTMARVVTPRTLLDIATAVKASPGPISIGGGRYSMGGQTATPDGLQLDMREYRGAVSFDRAARTITVRSGTRWREVQEAIDSAGFAVKIMQTYNTFTVGGALSVNAHGRYVGLGPVVRSVRAITLVLADGRIVTASRTQRPELFYGAIGGYGALGVIADVTLDLAENSRVRRDDETMPVTAYREAFRQRIRDDTTVIFHNADLYPPAYRTVHLVSYRRTDDSVTVPDRLLPVDQAAWSHRTAVSIITRWPAGKWMRQHVFDPLVFRGNPVTWRNYEASYDVSELEPASRDRDTYVLQEYFIPVDSFDVFVPRLRHILREAKVNVVNVSVRHALPDSGTLLTWAPTEVFAFVLYYRQGTDGAARRAAGQWTRELVEAALNAGGRYYLPYQPAATREQFLRAYPRSAEFFALKRRVDPTNKFTNTLWDLYQPTASGVLLDVGAADMPAVLPAETRMALDTAPGYTRDESAALITHPEWDLVYSSDAYAQWLLAGKRPSAFPYVASVGTFWRSYQGTWQAGRSRYSFGAGKHVMLGVIGLSTAIEYGIKGIYENTIGRLFELAMPPGGTDEDRYAAAVAAQYVDLIERRGWYEFSFARALKGLWTTVPFFGPGWLRKVERRTVLSAEYLVKAVYATLIGLGSGTAWAPDEEQRGIVVAGWTEPVAGSAGVAPLTARMRLPRGYTLLTVPRYNPFRDALLGLSNFAGSVRIAEVSGADFATLSGTAPVGWAAPPRTSVVVAYGVPADRARNRVLLRANARDLLDVLRSLRSEGQFAVEHIYDY